MSSSRQGGMIMTRWRRRAQLWRYVSIRKSGLMRRRNLKKWLSFSEPLRVKLVSGRIYLLCLTCIGLYLAFSQLSITESTQNTSQFTVKCDWIPNVVREAVMFSHKWIHHRLTLSGENLSNGDLKIITSYRVIYSVISWSRVLALYPVYYLCSYTACSRLRKESP